MCNMYIELFMRALPHMLANTKDKRLRKIYPIKPFIPYRRKYHGCRERQKRMV